MFLPFWFVLFTVSCMANVMGLNISSAFNSAVTVYVLIPLILIPQMILSGLLFRFDKLNDVISSKGKVPVVADLMASRWAYEAMAVYQFMNNTYQAPYYNLEKIEAQAGFRSSFLADELSSKRKFISDNLGSSVDSIRRILDKDLNIIRKSIHNDFYKKGLDDLNTSVPWRLSGFTPELNKNLEDYLSGYKKVYQDIYNHAVRAREIMVVQKESDNGSHYDLTFYKNRYYNESLADLVRNVTEKNRIIEYEGQLVQQINPVYQEPKPENSLDYRAHFFAPKKNLLGSMVNTYGFNLMVIWSMTVLLYVALYFEVLKKLVSTIGVVAETLKR